MRFLILGAFIAITAQAECVAQGKPTQVFIAPVKQEQVSDIVESIGTAKAFNSVKITSEVSSKITEIHFKEGQSVAKGELLFTLNDKEEKANLMAAKSTLSQKKRAYERAKNLLQTKTISEVVYQERESEHETALANVAAAQARLNLQQIKAPFSGTVGILDHSIGEFIQSGEEMVNLNDLSQMKLDFFVPSRYLNTLKVNDNLEAQTDAYNTKFIGKIALIDNQIDQTTRTIRVRALINNKENLLKDGMLMTVRIFAQTRSALTIPEEALIKRGEGNFVFKVHEKGEKKIAKYTPIVIGSRHQDTIEVLEGLDKDDFIVNHGLIKVRDGSEIIAKQIEDNNQKLQELIESK